MKKKREKRTLCLTLLFSKRHHFCSWLLTVSFITVILMWLEERHPCKTGATLVSALRENHNNTNNNNDDEDVLITVIAFFTYI